MVILNNILRVALKRGAVMNRGEEDYIKAIYELAEGLEEGVTVSNSALMTYLNHTAQTVNEMIKKLVKLGMVDYLPYKGSLLTASGLSEAQRMIRVHRLWETFLVNALGYGWEEVHEEAEILEHVTSSLLEERLFSFLGEPKVCPHGNFIPTAVRSEEYQMKRLTEAIVGQVYQLARVKDQKDLLTYLSTQGLKVGSEFKMLGLDTIGELITIELNSKPVIISFKIARQIFIK